MISNSKRKLIDNFWQTNLENIEPCLEKLTISAPLSKLNHQNYGRIAKSSENNYERRKYVWKYLEKYSK